MISASEARQLALPDIEAELAMCDKAVREAIARSKSSGAVTQAFVYKPLHDQTISKLKELGYTVSTYSDQRDGYTVTLAW